MKRKILSVILALALSLSALPLCALAAGDTAQSQAQALKSLSLFRGVSDTEFDLGRAPTRAEALVMLIRVLGQESAALAQGGTHPFTDVPAWADRYVGYAYRTGLTKGISAVEFGTGNANAAMYLTFMLRALGYSDAAGGDFTYADPFTLARKLGLLPAGVDTADFLREDAVMVSYAALAAGMKGTGTTLAESLEAAGVFTAAQYAAAVGDTTTSSSGSGTVTAVTPPSAAFSLSQVPAYSGDAYAVVNGNHPYFTEAELTAVSFETYSALDSLGRCGAAYASVGRDLMPTEERGPISSVKPTGWIQASYDSISGRYLYNRCHLIGYQLTAENANERNLVTGTRYLNTTGMLPFEDMVADYVKETSNHVQYRVTPIFDGNNLLPSGVLMEAESVEDRGDGVLFCVYCYNVQPGIVIDYATGASYAAGAAAPGGSSTSSAQSETVTYILNISSHKFHDPSCSGAQSMSEKNRQEYTGTRESLIESGYTPCGTCKP